MTGLVELYMLKGDRSGHNKISALLECLVRWSLRVYWQVIVMPPFEEEGVYCFANVGMLVGRSVDKMVSADYLKYHSSQSVYISHVGCHDK